MNKLIVFTAPSGAGKTTIVRHLLQRIDTLAFSVSATTRAQRMHERNGEDYYFMSPERFKHLVEANAFVEWEEVYDNQFYGTLRSEIERLWAIGKNILFDIEVKGATNIKRQYPQQTLAIFVKPPSPEELFNRLHRRGTEDEASLQKRIARAAEELTYENNFDFVLVNDTLEKALQEAETIVRDYLSTS
ncbi:MAG TPA: guanylate kinase [Saprospiraceae bacterium]|nr:guanylate kinase [Saprospiraceae bacterium]HMP13326.1 guanylate kinase [Saprospiraceae bacterium]